MLFWYLLQRCEITKDINTQTQNKTDQQYDHHTLIMCLNNFPNHDDASTNGWANNRDAGDLRRHGTDYDVTVMTFWCICTVYHGNAQLLSGHVKIIPNSSDIDFIRGDSTNLQLASQTIQ